MTGISTQIDDMLSGYVSKEEKTIEEPEEVVEEVGEVEEPEEVEDAGEEVEPEEPEEPEDEEPEREEATEEEEPQEEEEEEGGGEEDELAALRAEINRQSELLLKHGIMPPSGQEGGRVQEEGPAVETPSGTFEILGENESLDDVLNDRESFTKWAQGFAQRIIQSGTQQYASRLPSVVAPQVRQIIDLNRAVDQFYSVNSDLLPVRSTVGAIGRQLATEHPEWSLPQLFEESGRGAREILRMPAPGSKAKEKGGGVNPSFAKAKGSGRKPKPKVSRLQKEIDELL